MDQGKVKTPNERGSAMIMVMFSLVIMSIIGLSIVFTSSQEMRSSKNEMLANQAYYAAESGLQDVVNVLRGNRCPIGVTNCDPTVASNQVNFSLAASVSSSNRSTDTVDYPRLSKWLNYSSMDDDGVVVLNSSQGLSYAILVNPLAGGNLEIVSTGFAPLGAQRTLRLRVSSPAPLFTQLPAAITLLGQNPTGTGGSSNAHTISGTDAANPSDNTKAKPTVATVGAANLASLQSGSNFGGDKSGTLVTTSSGGLYADLTGGTIPFDNSADKARQFIADMTAVADTVVNSGGSLPSGALGTPSSPKVVVVNGDLSLNATDGAGILIVTGTLTMRGNCSYAGVIMCLGAGRVIRDGGGGGVISGGFLLGAFSAGSSTFDGSPDFHTNGGGSSDIYYNSTAGNGAIGLVPPVVIKSFSAE
ncbi:MAG TPA: pilus assembly PilX N-terminal domain-containing protein [Blastocatellia bacterium]|nr:pilus assembly PilX N-terminal domain-containing protein [Blastocatellia bacterium]